VGNVNDTLVTSTIVEALERDGALEIKSLFKQVKKLHSDIDNRFFDRTLMTMELHGLVRVYSMTKDKRRVELVRG
jgi:DNA-binding HxlR family transcriptional regulator